MVSFSLTANYLLYMINPYKARVILKDMFEKHQNMMKVIGRIKYIA